MFLGIRRDEDDFSLVGHDDKQRLIAQEQYLPAPVASFLPASLAGFQVYTGENPAVEAVNRVIVDYKIIERRLQLGRDPTLRGIPCLGVARQVDERRSDIRPGVKEDGVGSDSAWLSDPWYAEAGTGRRVFPEEAPDDGSNAKRPPSLTNSNCVVSPSDASCAEL